MVPVQGVSRMETPHPDSATVDTAVKTWFVEGSWVEYRQTWMVAYVNQLGVSISRSTMNISVNEVDPHDRVLRLTNTTYGGANYDRRFETGCKQTELEVGWGNGNLENCFRLFDSGAAASATIDESTYLINPRSIIAFFDSTVDTEDSAYRPSSRICPSLQQLGHDGNVPAMVTAQESGSLTWTDRGDQLTTADDTYYRSSMFIAEFDGILVEKLPILLPDPVNQDEWTENVASVSMHLEEGFNMSTGMTIYQDQTLSLAFPYSENSPHSHTVRIRTELHSCHLLETFNDRVDGVVSKPDQLQAEPVGALHSQRPMLLILIGIASVVIVVLGWILGTSRCKTRQKHQLDRTSATIFRSSMKSYHIVLQRHDGIR